jgi:hypothetical protein
MVDQAKPQDLDLALKRACPIYKRALSQAVDHGVDLDEAVLCMAIFAIGGMIAAEGADRAAQTLGDISAQFEALAKAMSDAAGGKAP